jgi:GrpB-like predicted nucleotidyltransferase (UPF0157 family)
MDKPPVIIVPDDSRWPGLYEAERGRIVEQVLPHLEAMEHIGGTAVPGLPSKPIIDIMPGLRRLSDARLCIEPLASIGYEYVPEHEKALPERRYFRKGPPEGRTHHLHMVEEGGGSWERYLLFRNHLRTHDATAHAYAALKRRLAREHGTNREAFTDGKSMFVQAVVERARLETASRPE